jgi:ribosome-binding factor A
MKSCPINSITHNMQEENRRIRRAADQIKNEVAWLIDHKLKDPRLGFVTLTRIKLYPDLKFASLYFSVYGRDIDQKKSVAILNRASHFLRRELSSKIKMRFIPELRFFYDDSLEYAERILNLFKKIHDDENNR